MKVVVINGNARHGNTWNCKDKLIKSISSLESIEVTEFVLPRDMPHFCNGCFSCIYNGENTCPHADKVSPIIASMENADVIILTTSVYGLDVTGQMKALLDHLCFMWLSHRPNQKMFKKVGVALATTAGMGLGHTTKTLKNNLKYWAIKRIFTFKKAVAAAKWDEVSEKKKAEIEKETAILAKKIVKTVQKADKLQTSFFIKFLFTLMKGMMKKNTWNPYDRKYWDTLGWLNGQRPF